MTSILQLVRFSAKVARYIKSMSQPLLIALVIFGLVVLSSILTVYFTEERPVGLVGGKVVFEGRDFSKTPFGMMDAYDACVLEAKLALGDTLLRSTMMPLSTRYEIRDNTYFVALDADVGTIKEWADATIYCTVDPVAHEISYYKEVYGGESSLLTRTMSLLGEILD